jgi:hypothetical protein
LQFFKERIMEAKQPSKEAVRAWMKDRREANTPPPAPERIRQELGWDMMREMCPLRQEFAR